MRYLISTIFFVFMGSAWGQTHSIVRDHAFGCSQKSEYEKLVSFAVDRDEEAFKRALLQGMLAGRCAMFQRGQRVFLSDTAIFSGAVSIRKAGDPASYWTDRKSVV